MKYRSKKTIWCVVFIVFAMILSGMANITGAQAKPKAMKLTLNVSSMTMKKGDRINLRVTQVTPASASKKVTWKSSNKKIVSVSKSGQIRAKAKGKATITARAKGGKAVAKCRLKVSGKAKGNSKVLVAYFSATNTTKGIAEKIASVSGGDLYRITPAKKYSAKDLDYTRESCRAVKEQKNKKVRPSMKGNCASIQQYRTVFIGFPIWSGDAPRIINTFMESYGFAGKTVIPFCTSGGTGIGKAVKRLKSSTKGKVTWRAGKQFDGNESKTEIAKWVNGLHLQNSQPENVSLSKTPSPSKTPDTVLEQMPSATPVSSPSQTPSATPVLSPSQTPDIPQIQPEEPEKTEESKMINIQVGTVNFTAELMKNSSAEAFAEKLAEGPLTIEMHDYGNFEKVGALGFDLPTNNEQITTEPGDVILYLGNQITIYYDTNSWNFTRLGKIQGVTAEELKSALGAGDVIVTFSLV